MLPPTPGAPEADKKIHTHNTYVHYTPQIIHNVAAKRGVCGKSVAHGFFGAAMLTALLTAVALSHAAPPLPSVSCYLRGNTTPASCCHSGRTCLLFDTYMLDRSGSAASATRHRQLNCYPPSTGSRWGTGDLAAEQLKTFTVATCEAACAADPRCDAVASPSARPAECLRRRSRLRPPRLSGSAPSSPVPSSCRRNCQHRDPVPCAEGRAVPSLPCCLRCLWPPRACSPTSLRPRPSSSSSSPTASRKVSTRSRPYRSASWSHDHPARAASGPFVRCPCVRPGGSCVCQSCIVSGGADCKRFLHHCRSTRASRLHCMRGKSSSYDDWSWAQRAAPRSESADAVATAPDAAGPPAASAPAGAVRLRCSAAAQKAAG